MGDERAGPQAGNERITVGLIPRVVAELDGLRESSGMSKTDIVNRAVSLYSFVDQHMKSGRQLALVDPDSGKVEIVHLL